MPDYSEQIKQATGEWFEKHTDDMYAIARASFDSGVEIVAAAIMTRVGKFLDENKTDLLTAVAAAIAASYERRQFGEMQRMDGA